MARAPWSSTSGGPSPMSTYAMSVPLAETLSAPRWVRMSGMGMVVSSRIVEVSWRSHRAGSHGRRSSDGRRTVTSGKLAAFDVAEGEAGLLEGSESRPVAVAAGR